jgi:hypothetical protein
MHTLSMLNEFRILSQRGNGQIEFLNINLSQHLVDWVDYLIYMLV